MYIKNKIETGLCKSYLNFLFVNLKSVISNFSVFTTKLHFRFIGIAV